MMDYQREVTRLAVCGLVSKDEYIINGLASELKRMAGVANVTDYEMTRAINSLIDEPVKGRDGSVQFVNTGHIKTRIDYYREQDARKAKDDTYKLQRENWSKDATGVPVAWKVQEAYLKNRDPQPADRENVLDAIRAEMLKYPKGSEMYKLWREAGISWKGGK